jgi:PTH1 family peptidyl-tRNA hydrolase
LRIGIGHPGDRNEVVNYVLKPPRREEQAEIDAAIERALSLVPLIEQGEWNAATQRANTNPSVKTASVKPKLENP